MDKFYGLLHLSFWGYVIATLIMTHITIASVTIYLHRHQAHRALELHPIISHFFRLWLWLTTGMVTRAWVAIHRKHHAKTETPDDPHSPQVLGLKKVLWEGAELYRSEAKNQETLEKYSYGTPEDWIERKLYTPYSSKGVLVMLGIDLLLFGIPGLTIWAVQMMWIPFFAAGIINGVGHHSGYRNFECPDASTNISPWGILIGGEELHNNHHTFATSAKLSVKWWEFDIGWMYIRTLSLLGLATVKKLPAELRSIPGKVSIDAETLKALVVNRFQVLARYSREVILPVLKEEKHKAGEAGARLFVQAKKLLCLDQSLLTTSTKSQLSKILEQEATLKLVYDFRLKLQSLWEKTTANPTDLQEALQQWCKQAEETGIEALRQFSVRIKGFVSQPVIASA
ncbi:MAG: fatty acid desaturase [Proteobacteria bacterium]|nr:fatty acid desaturase [Pseudomonadota bacterium]